MQQEGEVRGHSREPANERAPHRAPGDHRDYALRHPLRSRGVGSRSRSRGRRDQPDAVGGTSSPPVAAAAPATTTPPAASFPSASGERGRRSASARSACDQGGGATETKRQNQSKPQGGPRE